MLAGIFYFTLGNLDPKYRSRYRSIQLLAICKKKTLDKYSLCSVLRPFVDDMKKLVSSFVNVNAHHYPPLHTIRRRATHLVLKERAKYISAQLQLFQQIIQLAIALVALKKQLQLTGIVVSAW